MSLINEQYNRSMNIVFSIFVLFGIILAFVVFGRIFIRFVGLLAVSNSRTQGFGNDLYQMTEDLPELEAMQKLGEFVQ